MLRESTVAKASPRPAAEAGTKAAEARRRRPGPSAAMRWIRLLHVYAGLVLSLLLFVLALSGALLLYKHEYWRLSYAAVEGGSYVPSAAEQAAVIDAAYARYGDALRSIKLPEPGKAAWQLYLADGEAMLSPAGELIDEWRAGGRLMSWLFDLHAHLLAGESGEFVGGLIGLAGALMALSGLILWFPLRRRFALANLWPRGLSRRHLLFWHRDMGMLLSPLLLLLLLTGSGMVFYAQVQVLFNGLFGDEVPRSDPPRAEGTAWRLPDLATLERVNTYFPDARLTFYYPRDEGDGINRFRLKRDCELHPNGRSYLYTHAGSGEILQAEDACALPPGERLVHAVYPLHAGKTGSESYRLLALLGALVLAGLSLSGVVTYAQRLKAG